MKARRKPQSGAAKPKGTKVARNSPAMGKAQSPVKAKSAGAWPRDPRNVFREGAYATAFDILAAHPDGLTREKLVALLAKATGKDTKHAGFDAQVLLSAKPNEDGLSNNDSPCRHRSCRPGFYVVRTGDNFKLMVD